MRKLKIKKRESKLKRNITWIFLALLVLSTVGYAIVNSFGGSSGGTEEYEGFSRAGSFWTTEISGQKYYFSYLPSQVENITVDGNFSVGDYYSVPLYFTDENQGAIEILNNIGGYILRTQKACISEDNCEEDLPVKNCSTDNIIVFVDGEESVSKTEKCIYLSGDSVRSADKFLYEVLKIN